MIKKITYCILLSVIAASSLAQEQAGPYSKTDYSYRAMDIDSLKSGFADPPKEAGPWVYWICFDNSITAEEMKRQIREMAEAGIGGAELRFIEFVWRKKDEVDKELAMVGHNRLEYLSDEFLEVLEQACSESQRLGFKLAINMGMGWPPGGTWIKGRYRSRKLDSKVIVSEGPNQIGEETKLIVPSGAKVYAWQMEDGKEKSIVRGSFVDLSENVKDSGNKAGLFWDVPAGRWLVAAFWMGFGGKLDKATGYPADPGSKEAVEFHLNYIFEKLEPKLGKHFGTTLTEVTSDSWEYDGRPYWTEDIDKWFLKLNGYELAPKMYAMAAYGDDLERILSDIERAEQVLVRDNFFVYATEKLNSLGLCHRPQIRGRGLSRDFFEAFANCDIPEIEEEVYLPESVWVAHALGKPIISAEALTFISGHGHNLIYPFFRAEKRERGLEDSGKKWETNPALMRRHCNAHYARGINRVQLHSFDYSPDGIPLPGWRIYAEVHLNRNVPWWPYMKYYSDWSRRLQWVLQSGWAVSDTLVYPVVSNPADGPYGKQGDSQPVCAVNSVDAASDYIFGQIWEKDDYRYNIRNLCLLSDIKTLPEAEKIQQMLSCGVSVTYCMEEPAKWTVFRQSGNKAAAILKDFEKSMRQEKLVDGRNEGWKKVIESNRSVKWYPEESLLTYLHRRVKGADIYFLMNWGDDFGGDVGFCHAGMVPQIWDADTGRIEQCGQWRIIDDRLRIKMQIGHLESAIVVFVKAKPSLHAVQCTEGQVENKGGRLYAVLEGEDACRVQLSNGKTRELQAKLPEKIHLDDGWKLCVSDRKGVGVKGEAEIELEKLVSWRQISRISRYSGIGSYLITFDVGPEMLRDDLSAELDLGKVYEVAEVWLNGKKVAVSWYEPYKVDITGYLKQGRNELRVDVANVLKNYLAEGGYSRPSGLLGPVKIGGIARILLNQ